MHLSVILTCYNAADTIGEQLDALASQQWSQPWELLVVNNRSTDDSMAIVERYRDRLPQLRIVQASAKQGRAYALNTGVRAALGESVAFCDSDDIVAPGWVAAIGDALQKHDFVASSFEGQKLNPAWLLRVRDPGQRESLPVIWYPPYLPYAGGCGMGVKRALYERVGGFDEELLHVQDADFCFKIQLAGAPLHFVPAACIHIRLRHSFSAMFRQARDWAQYNVVIYKKYQPIAKTPMPEPWKRYGHDWVNLAVRAVRVRNRSRLGICVWLFGWQLGRLIGAIQCGVPPV